MATASLHGYIESTVPLVVLRSFGAISLVYCSKGGGREMEGHSIGGA